MVSCGSTRRILISLHRLFLRATNARKPLKPACTIPCVSNWPFLFFVIFLSNIRKLFNRSAAVSWCVGVGRAGRLFCKPLVGATARGGLQMCLTAKGWAGRLERMLFVFCLSCQGFGNYQQGNYLSNQRN